MHQMPLATGYHPAHQMVVRVVFKPPMNEVSFSHMVLLFLLSASQYLD
jgi:hypothetical protein